MNLYRIILIQITLNEAFRNTKLTRDSNDSISLCLAAAMIRTHDLIFVCFPKYEELWDKINRFL